MCKCNSRWHLPCFISSGNLLWKKNLKCRCNYYRKEIRWLTTLNYSLKVKNLIPCLGRWDHCTKFPLTMLYHWSGRETHTRRQRPDRLWSSYDQFTNVPRDGCSSRYRRTSPVISNVTFNQGIIYRNWAVLWNLFNIDGKDSIVRNTYFLGLLMH